MKDAGASRRKQGETVVKHYAQLAPVYDRRWDRYTRVSLSTLLEHLPLAGNEHLLDTACGTGRLAEMLREQHPDLRITGTDLSPDMIEVARGRRPDDERLQWQVASAESLPFDDETFEVVTCANAFHLIPDQTRALAEMMRVLKPGGTVCIVDWCREFPQIRALLRVTRMVGKQYRIILTRDELRDKMELAGLSVVDESTFKATWFWGLMCMVGRKPPVKND